LGEEIAADWRRHLAPGVGDGPLDRAAEALPSLRRVAEQAVDALLAQPFDPSPAVAAGAELERLLGPQPQRLAAAMVSLACALARRVPADSVADLQPRLSLLCGHLAAGYCGEVRAGRAQVEDALRARNRQLAALQETGRDLMSGRELNSVLHGTVERAARLLDASGGVLCRCDAERREVHAVVTYNAPSYYLDSVRKYGEGAGGLVAETGQGLIIDDYRNWGDRPLRLRDDDPIRALLSAPLKWRGQVTGVIHVFDVAPDRRFTEGDLELLTLFGDQAAVAIENARLHEQAQREIAERRQAEERLREANAFLEAILANLDAAVFLVDPDSRVIRECRGRVKDIFGYEPSELIGRDTRPLHVDEESFQRFPQLVRAAYAKTGFLSTEFRARRKNGEVFPSEHYVTFLRDSDGRPLRHVSLVRDITQRKRAQESELAVREQAARAQALHRASAQVGRALASGLDLDSKLRLIVDLAMVIMQADICGLWLADSQGNLTLRSVAGDPGDPPIGETVPAGMGLVGLAFQTGQPAQSSDLQTDPRTYYREDAGRTGSRGTLVVPLVMKGACLGSLAVILKQPHVFSDEEVALLASFADQAAAAVEQVRLHKEVADARSRLESVLRSVPDGVFTTDVECRVTSFNPTAERLTGWREAEALGQRCEDILGGGGSLWLGARQTDLLRQAMVERRPIPWSYREASLMTKQGTHLPVRGAIAPLYGSDGQVTGAVVSFTDASREVEVDRLRSEFVGLISHELRSPLASLEANISLLRQRGSNWAAQTRTLPALQDQARRLRGVVENLFAISELEAGRLSAGVEPIALDAFIRKTIASLFPPELASRCIIRAPKGLIVQAGPNKTALILRNLVDNALQYSPHESAVTVTAERLNSREALVAVTDSGYGIPACELEHVFDRLYRGRQEGPGAKGGYGMGLYLCRLLVTTQGGRIWAESEVGKGSAFRFTLPLMEMEVGEDQ
jgi:PAS domain S-box-containing protein